MIIIKFFMNSGNQTFKMDMLMGQQKTGQYFDGSGKKSDPGGDVSIFDNGGNKFDHVENTMEAQTPSKQCYKCFFNNHPK